MCFDTSKERNKRARLLRSTVGNKDLSDGQYAVKLVLENYDRLISQDKKISALASSICGGEPFVRGAG